ncbi:MAG: HAMP domain-containing histidine kinase [Spirochaetes bacterium]|nr:HAMP domain-containing histidine kinase [Spirochaetota bacterium]
MKHFFKNIPFFSQLSIHELEKSSLLLEKQYTELKEKDEENKKIYNQLKEMNKNLKLELEQKEEELKTIYQQRATKERDSFQTEIQSIEKEIAGGFAHRLKNLYGPVILLINNIYKKKILKQNKESLLIIFNVLKESIPENQFLKAIPMIERINESQKSINDIFQISVQTLEKNMRIINQFLDYSKLEKASSCIEADNVIQRILESNKIIFKKSSIILKKDLQSKMHININLQQFESLIQNLLSNAVQALVLKKENNIKKKISIRTSSPDHFSFYLEISDNGTGIPGKNINKIFDPFYTSNKRNGTGIGLSLCKRIVELYDGSIDVRSREKHGTSFFISLPSGEK